MLAAARRLPWCDALVRRGEFRGWRLLSDPVGVHVSGSTLGVVGMERIGAAVAGRCHLGFRMSVLYTSRRQHAEIETRLGARHVELDQLLRAADIVSLHAPLTPATAHLIDAAALRIMKPQAVLIHTGRWGLIDEHAVGETIEAGHLGGVGLDVFEHEPSIDPRLLA
jgi:lactate dehydrogenase-like 2-hydroxyacid dehydrogenase